MGDTVPAECQIALEPKASPSFLKRACDLEHLDAIDTAYSTHLL